MFLVDVENDDVRPMSKTCFESIDAWNDLIWYHYDDHKSGNYVMLRYENAT